MGPTTLLTTKFALEWQCSVGPMHCSWDPQTCFFNNFFIKNESHYTIYTFKNYFAIIFSVFSKISGIQMDLKYVFGLSLSALRLRFFFFLGRSAFLSNQWVPCTVHGTHKSLFFNKTFIKNGSHGNIHTFKNYFAIIFSVFSKINYIQTDP